MYLGMAAAGTITLAMMGVFVYLMRQQGRDVWFLYVFLTPFILAGALLAYFGGRFLLRRVLYGSWLLDVPGTGGEIGRAFDVTLFPSRTRVPSGELTFHLRCIRIVRRTGVGSSGGSADIKTLWETTWELNSGPIQPNRGLPLSLPMPATGEPTNMDRRTGSGTQWQLNVVIPTRDFEDQAVFDLPVRA